ncbi:MAG: desampylase [Haloarculaceae archaeon]
MLVASAVRDALLAHAREGAPEEVCGVLGGRAGPPPRVTTARRVPNVAARPRTEYRLDPEAQFAAMDAGEDAGETVVGFYHSHPRGPPRPSATDEARATWADHYYVVVVPDPAFVGAWRWTGERFERAPVQVE